ncbi:MAG: hypothetical protein ABF876_17400 [Acetobacter aceti]
MVSFKYIKNKVFSFFGDQKAQGALKLDKLNKKITDEFYYFIGKTGDDQNLYILWLFFVKRVGFNEGQSIKVIKMSGIPINDNIINDNQTLNEEATSIKLSETEIKKLIYNASIFSFRYILK